MWLLATGSDCGCVTYSPSSPDVTGTDGSERTLTTELVVTELGRSASLYTMRATEGRGGECREGSVAVGAEGRGEGDGGRDRGVVGVAGSRSVTTRMFTLCSCWPHSHPIHQREAGENVHHVVAEERVGLAGYCAMCPTDSLVDDVDAASRNKVEMTYGKWRTRWGLTGCWGWSSRLQRL